MKIPSGVSWPCFTMGTNRAWAGSRSHRPVGRAGKRRGQILTSDRAPHGHHLLHGPWRIFPRRYRFRARAAGCSASMPARDTRASRPSGVRRRDRPVRKACRAGFSSPCAMASKTSSSVMQSARLAASVLNDATCRSPITRAVSSMTTHSMPDIAASRVGKRAVGEGVVGFFAVSAALENQEQRFIPRCLAGGHHAMNARPDILPNFRPDQRARDGPAPRGASCPGSCARRRRCRGM